MYEYQAIIISVHDGDTIRADIDLGFGVWISNQPIRIYGIDTPELTTAAGKAARDHARALLPPGREVVMQTFKDAKEKYGRYLGKIETNGEDYAGLMTAAGHATPYFGGTKPPS